jgi:hypothetical protein
MSSCSTRRVLLVLSLSILLAPEGGAACADSSAVQSDTDSLHGPQPAASVSTLRTPIDSTTSTIDVGRLAIVGGTLAAGITTVHFYQATGWWKDNTSPFHFQEDLRYGLHVDKLGHFYGATALTFMFRKSLEWADFPEEKALHWGAAGAALFQTYVEIEDGFHTWGFDRVDFASDIAGAAYPVAQHYWPFLRNVNFKFSYHASPLLDKKGLDAGFKGRKHIFLDDYEGQTIWLSLSMKNILPNAAATYWPEWLCLAIGYGARDIGTADPNAAYRVYFIGLDLDATKIIPQSSAFLKTLSESLNFIRLPLPAVRISPGAIWYGLYF